VWTQSRSGIYEEEKIIALAANRTADIQLSRFLSEDVYRRVILKLGRAIAQAVSRQLPTAAARLQTRAWSCGIL
jgi:hypothetical protein